MKKYIALVTAVLLACSLASCSSKEAEEVPENDTAVEETASDTAENADDEASEPVVEEPVIEDPTMAEGEAAVVNEEEISYTKLHVEDDPKYENGVLIIYTLEDDLIYKPDSNVSVGMVASGAADSMSGTIVTADYPELSSGENTYKGVAIKTKYELEAGEWSFNVTFDDYIVKFDMTIN